MQQRPLIENFLEVLVSFVVHLRDQILRARQDFLFALLSPPWARRIPPDPCADEQVAAPARRHAVRRLRVRADGRAPARCASAQPLPSPSFKLCTARRLARRHTSTRDTQWPARACCCTALRPTSRCPQFIYAPSLPPPLRAASTQLARSAVAPTMMVEPSSAVSTLAVVGTTLAGEAEDFGGYTIPIVGLGLLAAIISLLAGPVED